MDIGRWYVYYGYRSVVHLLRIQVGGTDSSIDRIEIIDLQTQDLFPCYILGTRYTFSTNVNAQSLV